MLKFSCGTEISFPFFDAVQQPQTSIPYCLKKLYFPILRRFKLGGKVVKNFEIKILESNKSGRRSFNTFLLGIVYLKYRLVFVPT